MSFKILCLGDAKTTIRTLAAEIRRLSVKTAPGNSSPFQHAGESVYFPTRRARQDHRVGKAIPRQHIHAGE